MTKRTAFKYVLLFAFILQSAAARTPAPVLSELPDGRGGTNVESVSIPTRWVLTKSGL
jgi:hypothetical protein